MSYKKVVVFLVLLLSLPLPLQAYDNKTCGITRGHPLTNGYGPYDYTNPSHLNKIPIVLKHHFSSDVERLIRGVTNTDPRGDIDYTLRAIPNYHPALYAISRLELRAKAALKSGMVYRTAHYTADCYFKRAIYFQPRDGIARMLYGLFLHKSGRLSEAEKVYGKALELADDNAELHYNVGLLYLEMKKIDKAKMHAEMAEELGYPLKGLQKRLSRY
ncbi:MAG: hypothetical protein CSB48_05555 [Proteobacteria bacterium]|nr:MAG: hypothetical protein CSB48_05555 [Pseudomonadota bacterium]